MISNNTIFKNGENIFENKDISLHDFLVSVYQHFHIVYPKFYKMDNLSKLGWLACEILLQEFVKDSYLPEETGVVLSNANSSFDTDLKYFETISDVASPSLFVYTLPNIMAGEICIRNNFKGENAFFVSEHFDAAFMEEYVSNLFDSEALKICICGWVDVYDEEYKAGLFLVKQEKNEISFTTENMFRIFKTDKS